jgi:hypothetical protein
MPTSVTLSMSGKLTCAPFQVLQVRSFAVRKWLAVNAHGEAQHLELAKLHVTATLGVQLRDLR